MKGFKDSTRTRSGFSHWGGNSIGGGHDKIDANPGHPEVYPKTGDRMHGNAATQRDNPPTQELTEHGGRTPIISKFKRGGSTKHFHVHKHFHAKGGRTHSVSHSYAVAEKHAEKYADGGHVHDSTHIPAGSPDYAKGGKARRPVKKNAGGALYATGGTINKLAMGGVPMQGTPATGALGRLAMRPQGMPMRPKLPMRRPIAMPGPQPVMRAKGGGVHSDAAQDRSMMQRVAKQAVGQHVRTAPPKGHGVK